MYSFMVEKTDYLLNLATDCLAVKIVFMGSTLA